MDLIKESSSSKSVKSLRVNPVPRTRTNIIHFLTTVMRVFTITSPTGETIKIFSPPNETRESFPFKHGSRPNRARPPAWKNDD